MSPDLRPGAHIHFVAVCGVGTGSLAGLLRQRGYRVTGSDENVYPPMSTFLESIGIDILPGFSEAHLGDGPDLVVIGNAVSRGNAEAEAVLRRGIPYVSLPQALGRFLIDGKHSLVVAGTHGKTTTTSLMSWVLVAAGLDPSFFIGGIPVNFGSGFRSGEGSWVVMEGDEYDSAFFDKGPKFLHYRPERVILTSLEFDHADIYRDLEHLQEAFRRLVKIVPPGGGLLVCDEAAHAMSLLDEAACPVLSYGLGESADWQARDIHAGGGRIGFTPCRKGVAEGPVEVPLIGRHNAKNALAVYATAREIGLSPSVIRSAMATFRGVRRRQEIAGEAGGVLVIDDFAHTPPRWRTPSPRSGRPGPDGGSGPFSSPAVRPAEDGRISPAPWARPTGSSARPASWSSPRRNWALVEPADRRGIAARRNRSSSTASATGGTGPPDFLPGVDDIARQGRPCPDGGPGRHPARSQTSRRRIFRRRISPTADRLSVLPDLCRRKIPGRRAPAAGI